MEPALVSPKSRTNRNLPVEQWPESLELLRQLASLTKPRSVRELAQDVSAPEISTRNRLIRLASLGAVQAVVEVSTLETGKQVTCTHYVITSYGRDCAVAERSKPHHETRPRVNSVFALAWAMNASG